MSSPLPRYKVTPLGLLTPEEMAEAAEGDNYVAPEQASIFTPQELSDAALDLEVEKVERALAWDRMRAEVTVHRIATYDAIVAQDTRLTRIHAYHLVKALEELERLEGAGGAA